MSLPLVYRSYAKINLYLEVLCRRSDGYHNIETIFQTVGLFDELRFEERPSGISLTCSDPELAAAETNLAYRAAALLQERYSVSAGAHIDLTKHIPLAAGLAGGSGNAAATLVALNAMWELRLPIAHLQTLALELGSDVPYCVAGGTMGATGRGEQLFELTPLPSTWFVLVHPGIPVSAARVYNSPSLRCSNEPAIDGKTASFQAALDALGEGRMGDVVANGMESAVFESHPELAEIKRRLLEGGCIAGAMSGSGPTIFGIAPTQRTAKKIAARFVNYPTSVVQNVPRGIERM